MWRNIIEALAPGADRTQQIARILSIPETRVLEFAQEMLCCGWESVDDFLQRRPEYLQIGKVAIAQEIAYWEEGFNLAIDQTLSQMLEAVRGRK